MIVVAFECKGDILGDCHFNITDNEFNSMKDNGMFKNSSLHCFLATVEKLVMVIITQGLGI